MDVNDLMNIFNCDSDTALGRLFGRKKGAVSVWRSKGLPPSIQIKVAELMNDMGIVADPAPGYEPQGELTLEQKLAAAGLNARQIRTLQEMEKMEEEEQDELLKKMTIVNLEKGRY